jgi:hypothetical protein
VNVLVARVWLAHESHNKVHNWFQQQAKAGWAKLSSDTGRVAADCVESRIFAELCERD